LIQARIQSLIAKSYLKHSNLPDPRESGNFKGAWNYAVPEDRMKSYEAIS